MTSHSDARLAEKVTKVYSCRWSYKDGGVTRIRAADAMEATRKAKQDLAGRLGYMESCIEILEVEIPE